MQLHIYVLILGLLHLLSSWFPCPHHLHRKILLVCLLWLSWVKWLHSLHFQLWIIGLSFLLYWILLLNILLLMLGQFLQHPIGEALEFVGGFGGMVDKLACSLWSKKACVLLDFRLYRHFWWNPTLDRCCKMISLGKWMFCVLPCSRCTTLYPPWHFHFTPSISSSATCHSVGHARSSILHHISNSYNHQHWPSFLPSISYSSSQCPSPNYSHWCMRMWVPPSFLWGRGSTR